MQLDDEDAPRDIESGDRIKHDACTQIDFYEDSVSQADRSDGYEEPCAGDGWSLATRDECRMLRSVHHRIRQFAALMQLWVEDPEHFDFVGEWAGPPLPAEVSDAMRIEAEAEDALIAALKCEAEACLNDASVPQEAKVRTLQNVAARQKLLFLKRAKRVQDMKRSASDRLKRRFERLASGTIEDDILEEDPFVSASAMGRSCIAMLSKLFVFFQRRVVPPMATEPSTVQVQPLKVPFMLGGGTAHETVLGLCRGLPTCFDQVALPNDLEELQRILDTSDGPQSLPVGTTSTLFDLFRVKYSQTWDFGAEELQRLRDRFLRQFAAEAFRKTQDMVLKKRAEMLQAVEADLHALHALKGSVSASLSALKTSRRASVSSASARGTPPVVPALLLSESGTDGTPLSSSLMLPPSVATAGHALSVAVNSGGGGGSSRPTTGKPPVSPHVAVAPAGTFPPPPSPDVDAERDVVKNEPSDPDKTVPQPSPAADLVGASSANLHSLLHSSTGEDASPAREAEDAVSSWVNQKQEQPQKSKHPTKKDGVSHRPHSSSVAVRPVTLDRDRKQYHQNMYQQLEQSVAAEAAKTIATAPLPSQSPHRAMCSPEAAAEARRAAAAQSLSHATSQLHRVADTIAHQEQARMARKAVQLNNPVHGGNNGDRVVAEDSAPSGVAPPVSAPFTTVMQKDGDGRCTVVVLPTASTAVAKPSTAPACSTSSDAPSLAAATAGSKRLPTSLRSKAAGARARGDAQRSHATGLEPQSESDQQGQGDPLKDLASRLEYCRALDSDGGARPVPIHRRQPALAPLRAAPRASLHSAPDSFTRSITEHTSDALHTAQHLGIIARPVDHRRADDNSRGGVCSSAVDGDMDMEVSVTVSEQLMVDAMIRTRLQRAVAPEKMETEPIWARNGTSGGMTADAGCGEGAGPQRFDDGGGSAVQRSSLTSPSPVVEVPTALPPAARASTAGLPTDVPSLTLPSRRYQNSAAGPNHRKPDAQHSKFQHAASSSSLQQVPVSSIGVGGDDTRPLSSTRNIFAAQPLPLVRAAHKSASNGDTAAGPPLHTQQQQPYAPQTAHHTPFAQHVHSLRSVAGGPQQPPPPLSTAVGFEHGYVDTRNASTSATDRHELLLHMLSDTVHQAVTLDGASLQIAVPKPTYSFLL